jgi:hypothetical protein
VRARGIARRIWRAARLEAALYEEVEADRAATHQAFAVVLLAAVGAGIGSFHNGGLRGIALSALAWLVGWYLWARTAWWIGTRLLPGPETRADTGELLRTLGFSSAPGVLLALALYEPLAGAVFLLCGLWMLAAMVIAVRQALDYRGSLRAVAVCALGFPVYAAILGVTLLLLGPWPV